VTGLSLRANGNAYVAQVGVRNDGDAPASGSVELRSDSGAVLASGEWSADARQDTYVGFDSLQNGQDWIEARLASVSPSNANALSTDDQAWAMAPTTRDTQQRALLVTPGNTFLERVLAVDGSLRTFKIPPSDWPVLVSQGDAAGYALVVLDRQPRGTAPRPAGGSVLYVAGADGDSFQPHLIAPLPDDPLLRNVDWSDVRIGRATRLSDEDRAGWQTVVDSDGGPLLLVRSVREGDQVRREALLTFELGESDLPLRSAFPVLMANLLDWLVPRPDATPRSVAPGESLQLEASPLTQSLRVESALDPTRAPEQLAPPWPPRPFRATTPGVYRAIEDAPDGQVVTSVVAAAFAASESDLRVREPAIASTDADGVGQVLRDVRSGIWPWLLALLLGLATLEWVVDARGR
jgi:hypothetical protein